MRYKKKNEGLAEQLRNNNIRIGENCKNRNQECDNATEERGRTGAMLQEMLLSS